MSAAARGLWARWVAANALGEMFGLGFVATVAWGIAGMALPPVPNALALIAAGIGEGLIVGCAQWLVLRRAIPAITARAWILATLYGALVAWVLGMLPSTTIDLLAHDAGEAGAAPPELGAGLELLLAAALGCVGGTVLSLFQWRAMRAHVARAHLWIVANAAAWMIGMPMIFYVASNASAQRGPAFLAIAALSTFAAVGAAVGAVHGIALVALSRAMDHDGTRAESDTLPVRVAHHG